MQIKHSSWSYENEWRIILLNPRGSGLVKCPIQPTAIYFGVNSDHKDINKIREKVNCPTYKLKQTNTEFFKLDTYS